MVTISIDGSALILEVEGWDRLWALKSRLEILLLHVSGVEADPSIAHGWWKGFRAPGTQIPGVVTAGTFYQDGRRVFWDVHDPEGTIVIDLIDERYNRLVVEVADPQRTVEQIRAALASIRPES